MLLFAADLGGLLGLFLGGSAISVFEIVDLIIYNLAIQAGTVMRKKKRIQPKKPDGDSKDATSQDKAKKPAKMKEALRIAWAP
jgi:hypothetical protein